MLCDIWDKIIKQYSVHLALLGHSPLEPATMLGRCPGQTGRPFTGVRAQLRSLLTASIEHPCEWGGLQNDSGTSYHLIAIAWAQEAPRKKRRPNPRIPRTMRQDSNGQVSFCPTVSRVICYTAVESWRMLPVWPQNISFCGRHCPYWRDIHGLR